MVLILKNTEKILFKKISKSEQFLGTSKYKTLLTDLTETPIAINT